MSPDIDTAILGAGPYGLSLSAHLTAAGVPHKLFGKPMHAWREFMPTGMLLRSEAFATSLHAPLPGYSIEDYFRIHKMKDYQPVGMRLPLETFIAYALWFQRHLVKDISEGDVTSLDLIDGLYRLRCDDGTVCTARRVVVALGLRDFDEIPSILQGLPQDLVTHSAHIGDLTWATDKDITIVGGGQSALGLAALMHERNARVHLIIRDKAITWNEKPLTSRSFISRLLNPEGGLGAGWRSHILSEYPFLFYHLSYARRKKMVETSWGPSGAWWLRDRVVDKVDIKLGCNVTAATVTKEGVELQILQGSECSIHVTDTVVVATGYRVNLRRHGFLSGSVLNSCTLIDGQPKLTRSFETSVPNLYVVGPAAAYSFGPAMRFIYGAKYAAPCVARHIAKRL